MLKEHWSPENWKFSTLSSGKIEAKFLKSLKKSNRFLTEDWVLFDSLTMVNAATDYLFKISYFTKKEEMTLIFLMEISSWLSPMLMAVLLYAWAMLDLPPL